MATFMRLIVPLLLCLVEGEEVAEEKISLAPVVLGDAVLQAVPAPVLSPAVPVFDPAFESDEVITNRGGLHGGGHGGGYALGGGGGSYGGRY